MLYADVALKMGASATGNPARLDSDCSNSVPTPPTKRLTSAFADSDDTRMSIESVSSSPTATPSTSTCTGSINRIVSTRKDFLSIESENPIDVSDDDDINYGNIEPKSDAPIDQNRPLQNRMLQNRMLQNRLGTRARPEPPSKTFEIYVPIPLYS